LACRQLYVDAPSRVDQTMAPDIVLAIRHAALGARRRRHAGGAASLVAELHTDPVRRISN
jgi:hypothetical protein